MNDNEPTESWLVTVVGCLMTALLIWIFLSL